MNIGGDLAELSKTENSNPPVLVCPCCRKKTEFFNVYFAGNLEALRCGLCGIAFPK